MTSKLTRDRLQEIAEDGFLKHGESKELACMALAAMDGEPFAYIIHDKYERERGVEGHLSRSHVSKYVSQEDINEHEITCTPLYRHAQPATVTEREPIAWLNDAYLARGVVDGEAGSEDAGPGYIPVYREAGPQPAPVVPDDLLSMAASAIEDLLEHTDPNTSYYSGVCADVPGKLRAAAPQLPGSETATVPGKWIPVSERMPIDFEAVIAFDGDQVYGEAMYSSDDGFTIDGYEPCDRLKLQNVTHWMPLPPPPTEVK